MLRSTPELIAHKRDGLALTTEEIQTIIQKYTHGELPEYQMAAFAMAVFFRGMNESERVALTLAMRDSGSVIDLSTVKGVKVDKHSTGGVGDKVSLCLAPMVASCGVPVPMVSGRGLGHTGGTLDKLEAIPGFSVNLSVEKFREMVRDIGVSMIGQTREIAPADKKLYALRDVTATVESIPLIVASILSKKLAEGIDGLVLDVKVGRGAFMKTRENARALADALVSTARGAGKKCVALLTRMESPLGRTVGNALETIEAFEVLHDRGPSDLVECTYALGAEMLLMGNVARSLEHGHELLHAAVRDGRARECARRMIEAQGGDPRVVDEFDRFAKAPVTLECKATSSGFIQHINAHEVGLTACAMGAGRSRAEDTIDPSVGIVFERVAGESVREGDVIAVLHARDLDSGNQARTRLTNAITYSAEAVDLGPLVLERVG